MDIIGGVAVIVSYSGLAAITAAQCATSFHDRRDALPLPLAVHAIVGGLLWPLTWLMGGLYALWLLMRRRS